MPDIDPRFQAQSGNVFIERCGESYTVFIKINGKLHPKVFEQGSQGWFWADQMRKCINGES